MMAINFNDVLAFTLIHCLAVISPGPDFAVTLQSSFSDGRKKGFTTALGITCGVVVHLVYITLGLATVITKTPWAFTTLKYLGCLYLIYIGIKNLLNKPYNPKDFDSTRKKLRRTTDWQAFYKGFLTNALNPKCIIFLLSLFSVVLERNDSSLLMFIYGFIALASTLLWFSVVVFIFSHRLIRNNFIKHIYIIERITGVFLIILSIKLAVT